jgi:hypothetical protein
MEALIDVWERPHEHTMKDYRVILSADAIAFRSMVTISDDGLKDLTHVDNPDPLTHFLADPASFSAFLREHWDSTCSSSRFNPFIRVSHVVSCI